MFQLFKKSWIWEEWMSCRCIVQVTSRVTHFWEMPLIWTWHSKWLPLPSPSHPNPLTSRISSSIFSHQVRQGSPRLPSLSIHGKSSLNSGNLYGEFICVRGFFSPEVEYFKCPSSSLLLLLLLVLFLCLSVCLCLVVVVTCESDSYIMATTGMSTAVGLRQDDVLYSPFPLYHSVGIILGVGQGLLLGPSVVLRTKFSASAFWKDCIEYRVTVWPFPLTPRVGV